MQHLGITSILDQLMVRIYLNYLKEIQMQFLMVCSACYRIIIINSDRAST